MNIFTLIHSIGSIGLFSSRAFLTAFATALLLRLGPDVPILQNADFLQAVGDAPTWFTKDSTLLILGLLSAIEVFADKSPEARALLQEVDRYIKPAMAGLTYAGMITATDVQFVEKAIGQTGFVDYLLMFVIVPGVYLLSTARAEVLAFFSDADEDDDIGVQGLISWAEDIGVVGGLLFLILFPVVMLVLLGMISGLLLLARKRAEAKEEKAKVACPNCSQMIYPCAIACSACGTQVSSPTAIGVLGQSKQTPAPDLKSHPYRLTEKKRCPVCATRLTERAAHQDCPVCGHKLFADPNFANDYLANVGKRLPLVLGVSFLLSLVPVVGLIPGVIYYRMAIVAPFRRYIPLSKRIVLKWLIRLFFFFLIAIQWVPLLGGFVVPVMAIVNYGAYRSAFRAQLQTS